MIHFCHFLKASEGTYVMSDCLTSVFENSDTAHSFLSSEKKAYKKKVENRALLNIRKINNK